MGDTFNVKNNFMYVHRKLSGKRIKVEAFGKIYKNEMDVESYGNGRPAVLLNAVEDGSPFGTLTCNLPDVELEEKEIIVKTWSENAEKEREMAYCCLKTGLFRDTGKRIATGFVQAQVWEVL